MPRLPLLVSLAALATACGTLPRDPAHTLERVSQEHHLRIGVAENAPWVMRTPDGPAGAEVELARRFAAALGATPGWSWGSEQQHMEALERFELDLVLAGLDTATAWTKKVGLTRPYFVERIVVGVPANARAPNRLSGMSILVKGGDAVAAEVIKKDARPVRVAEITEANQPAVGPEWRLQQLGFKITRFELQKKKHVMAVPPGENGWLKRLQEFLNGEQGQVTTLLQKSEGRR